MKKRGGGAGLKAAQATLMRKYGTTNIAEIAKLKKRGGGASAGRKANPASAKPKRSSKRTKSRKQNPPAPAAPKPAAVQSNPTEIPTMKSNRAKRRSKKRRTAKQKAATRRMIAANRRGKRRRRRNPAAGVKSNPATVAGVKSNPRRKRRKSRRRKSGRRRNPVIGHGAKRGHGERRVGAKRRHLRNKRVGGYSRGGYVKGHFRRTNPTGLLGNQGPFTRDRLMGFGIAAVGVGIGLAGASMLDRFVATRTPKDGKHPWHGRAAAGAIALRPDAMRLGAQAGLAVAAMAGGYLTRNMRGLPWFFGGLAVGAGSNLVRMLVESYLMPAVLSAKDGSEVVLGNRLYPLEQKYVQDSAIKFFQDYKTTPSLMNIQTAAEASSQSPLAAGLPTISVFALGEQQPRFVADGTVGHCTECNSTGGHTESCSSYCSKCSAVYAYDVLPGDNLLGMATLSGIDPNYVAGMNGNKSLSLMKPGDTVRIPFLFGEAMRELAQRKNVDLTSDDDRRNGRLGGNGNGHDAAPPPPIQPPSAASREPGEIVTSSQYEPAE